MLRLRLSSGGSDSVGGRWLVVVRVNLLRLDVRTAPRESGDELAIVDNVGNVLFVRFEKLLVSSPGLEHRENRRQCLRQVFGNRFASRKYPYAHVNN